MTGRITVSQETADLAFEFGEALRKLGEEKVNTALEVHGHLPLPTDWKDPDRIPADLILRAALIFALPHVRRSQHG